VYGRRQHDPRRRRLAVEPRATGALNRSLLVAGQTDARSSDSLPVWVSHVRNGAPKTEPKLVMLHPLLGRLSAYA